MDSAKLPVFSPSSIIEIAMFPIRSSYFLKASVRLSPESTSSTTLVPIFFINVFLEALIDSKIASLSGIPALTITAIWRKKMLNSFGFSRSLKSVVWILSFISNSATPSGIGTSFMRIIVPPKVAIIIEVASFLFSPLICTTSFLPLFIVIAS